MEFSAAYMSTYCGHICRSSINLQICSVVPPRARVKFHRKQRGYKQQHAQRVETSQPKSAATTLTLTLTLTNSARQGNTSAPNLSHPWPETPSLPATSQQTVSQQPLIKWLLSDKTRGRHARARRAVGGARVGFLLGKVLLLFRPAGHPSSLDSPGFEGRLRLGDLLGDVGEVASKEVPNALRVGDAVERFLGVHLCFQRQHPSTRGWLGCDTVG